MELGIEWTSKRTILEWKRAIKWFKLVKQKRSSGFPVRANALSLPLTHAVLLVFTVFLSKPCESMQWTELLWSKWCVKNRWGLCCFLFVFSPGTQKLQILLVHILRNKSIMSLNQCQYLHGKERDLSSPNHHLSWLFKNKSRTTELEKNCCQLCCSFFLKTIAYEMRTVLAAELLLIAKTEIGDRRWGKPWWPSKPVESRENTGFWAPSLCGLPECERDLQPTTYKSSFLIVKDSIIAIIVASAWEVEEYQRFEELYTMY